MEFYQNPTFLITISISGVILAVALKNYYFGKTRFFRESYFAEVRKIEQAIHDYTHSFGEFTNFLSSHPTLGKQILQHIYTFDQTAFNKLKESLTFQRINQSQNHEERDRIFDESQYTINEKYWSLEYETRPEFGACKDCWKFLNRAEKKRYENLNDLTDDFWDWTKW